MAEKIKGFCKLAALAEIQKHNFLLTLSRYIGIKDEINDVIPFQEKMKKLTAELEVQFEEESKLNKTIKRICKD